MSNDNKNKEREREKKKKSILPLKAVTAALRLDRPFPDATWRTLNGLAHVSQGAVQLSAGAHHRRLRHLSIPAKKQKEDKTCQRSKKGRQDNYVDEQTKSTGWK